MLPRSRPFTVSESTGALRRAAVIIAARCAIVLRVPLLGKRPCPYGMTTERWADIPRDIVAVS